MIHVYPPVEGWNNEVKCTNESLVVLYGTRTCRSCALDMLNEDEELVPPDIAVLLRVFET